MLRMSRKRPGYNGEDDENTIDYGHMGVSENVVYPIVPNGFADHYPVFKWLFHWEYTQHFQTNPYPDKPISCHEVEGSKSSGTLM